ncbi:MAG: DUF2284 domain-containing protein [Clostridia bacterium]|nr:DUF2284 domain-containing protein [Clostridia bacterium]
MDISNYQDWAREEGFAASALISTDQIVFDSRFLRYCEDNLCGQYGANYSCPPDCGTPEQMRASILRYSYALVVQTRWNIPDWRDAPVVKRAKGSHNRAMLRLIERIQAQGVYGLMAGASCCMLCERCARRDNAPCLVPQTRFSCLSAYCIYVAKLAETCGMEYMCADGSTAFFGLYAFNPPLQQ